MLLLDAISVGSTAPFRSSKFFEPVVPVFGLL